MKSSWRRSLGVLLVAFVCGSPAEQVRAAAAPAIDSRTAVVDGLSLHYLTAGHGLAVILLHGYTQTSAMWRPVLPLLAERLNVLDPELAAIGRSSIPGDG